jgi:hypothetical protein
VRQCQSRSSRQRAFPTHVRALLPHGVDELDNVHLLGEVAVEARGQEIARGRPVSPLRGEREHGHGGRTLGLRLAAAARVAGRSTFPLLTSVARPASRRLRIPPAGCRGPATALANEAGVTGARASPRAELGAIAARWETPRSRRPCHPRATSRGHERYMAVSHGHSREAVGLGARPADPVPVGEDRSAIGAGGRCIAHGSGSF